MPEEIKPADIMDAVKALRAEVESKSPDLEKIEKIESGLEAQETKSKELLEQVKTAEQSAIEFKERIDGLEVEVARASSSTGKSNYKESEEYKALNALCQVGEGRINDEQKALLRTDNDVSGGYLVQGEMDNVITKKITEISDIRSIARVRTISSKSLEMPIRSSILSATYEGEAATGNDDTSLYANETITPFRQTVTVPITKDMLMDASFDMENEIMGDAGESFAQGEGLNFVLGDGVKKPEGFLDNATILANLRTSGTSGTVDADDLLLLTGDLKVGYNPVYTFSRATLAFIRTLKGSDGHYLWQPGFNGAVANTINGFPYLIANDMPAIASLSLSIAFGDFMRGYTIVDRTGMAVVRDEVTQKKLAIVEFTINRWNTGKVVLPEAIKVLQTQA